MAQRAIWSGIINFGLVSIPVNLYSATATKGLSFHQIHDECQTRIQEKRWCPTCERMVEWGEIAKGYEYEKGKYVVITDEDLESLPLPAKEVIAIQSFVKLDEIDPVYFDKSYYLQSEEKATRPFTLFLRALAEKEMVAIGTFAIRSKERLCCLRPVGGILMVDTLLYPDEIKVDLDSKLPKAKVSEQEMNMVSKLIDMMVQPFDPEMYKDHYREALQEVIDAKLKGVKVKAPVKEAGKGQVLYLMDALKRSVEEIEKGKRKGSAGKSRSRTAPKTERTSTRRKRKAS